MDQLDGNNVQLRLVDDGLMKRRYLDCMFIRGNAHVLPHAGAGKTSVLTPKTSLPTVALPVPSTSRKPSARGSAVLQHLLLVLSSFLQF